MVKKGADGPDAAAWSSEAWGWAAEGNTGTIDGAGRSLDNGTLKVIDAPPASLDCRAVGVVVGPC